MDVIFSSILLQDGRFVNQFQHSFSTCLTLSNMFWQLLLAWFQQPTFFSLLFCFCFYWFWLFSSSLRYTANQKNLSFNIEYTSFVSNTIIHKLLCYKSIFFHVCYKDIFIDIYTTSNKSIFLFYNFLKIDLVL